MAEDEPIFNGENYRNTDTYGFKTIVLKQVQKIVTIYSQELTEGFMKYSQPNQFGKQEPVNYVSDGRIAYCQSVEVLHDILQRKFDKEMKDFIEQSDKDINEAYKLAKENNLDTTEWYKEKVILMRKVFQELCMFLDRLGWLEEGSIEDG